LVQKLSKLTKRQQIEGGIVLLCLVTLALWLGTDYLGTAARLTAYGVCLLAAGTIGLAIGAVGTYGEQRKQNARLEAAEMARVFVLRVSGPDQFVRIAVSNQGTRAIRDLYVWAEAEGINGLYPAAVLDDRGHIARKMTNQIPRNVDGGTLWWRLRALLPGDQATFYQVTYLAEQPIPGTIRDDDITAFAEFLGTDGTWWRADEDGNVGRAPYSAPYVATPDPMPSDHGGLRRLTR
jgi:hypothetical protein